MGLCCLQVCRIHDKQWCYLLSQHFLGLCWSPNTGLTEQKAPKLAGQALRVAEGENGPTEENPVKA